MPVPIHHIQLRQLIQYIHRSRLLPRQPQLPILIQLLINELRACLNAIAHKPKQKLIVDFGDFLVLLAAEEGFLEGVLVDLFGELKQVGAFCEVAIGE